MPVTALCLSYTNFTLQIPTLDDIINMVVTQYTTNNFTIGLFPETKVCLEDIRCGQLI